MKSQVSQTQRHQVTENITTIRLQRENKIKVDTMRKKARGMTQHGSPPGWLKENDPARLNLPNDGCFRGRLIYCLTEPRAATSVIESKHKLWMGEIAYVYV
jgi:hypothetical protein